MKADDEILHMQMHESVAAIRRSIGADHMVLVTSFHDDEVGAQATLLSFDFSREGSLASHQAQLAEIAQTLLRGVNNILQSGGKGRLKVILRDSNGHDIDINETTFGHHAVEMT
jgi:hypothetical protein